MGNNSDNKKIGFWAVVAIGIGGMVGGGIFAVLGLAVQLARGGTPIAFFLAGIVTLITTYSYSKLSVTYPSEGGTVEFINQAFGRGIFTGGLNILLWLSYVIMLSLYSYAFGSYASSFFSSTPAFQEIMKHIFISFIVIILTLVNIKGANVVGKAETWIVGIKMLILVFFTIAGLLTVNMNNLAPSTWEAPIPLMAGGMIIFVAYEGFELIANTAQDVKNRKKILPRAYFSAVILVLILYILISIVTVGNLPLSKIISSKDYALAVVAEPFLGYFGYILITIAALLATASAVNATLYGSSYVSYIIAKDGELPKQLEKRIWHKNDIEGLFITTGITLLVANLFNLNSISTMGSAGFLLIFAFVNLSNVLLYKYTKSKKWISILGFIVCTIALGALIMQTLRTFPHNIWILVIMLLIAFLIELIYRRITGRSIIPYHRRNGTKLEKN